MLVFHFRDLAGLVRKREEIGSSTTGGEAGGGGARVGEAGESAGAGVGAGAGVATSTKFLED